MVKKTYLLWEIKKFGKEITKALNLGLINKKELITPDDSLKRR